MSDTEWPAKPIKREGTKFIADLPPGATKVLSMVEFWGGVIIATDAGPYILNRRTKKLRRL